MRPSLHAVLASVALLAASCGFWTGPPRGTHSGDLILVPHAKHKKAGVECIACHETVYDAKALGSNDLPPEAKCLECHREEKAKGNCGFCHTDVKHARAYPPREASLHMSHAGHIDRVKEDCARCHTALPEPVRTRDLVPPMRACTSCHEHQASYDQGRCQECHIDLKRFRLEPVLAFSHKSGNYIHEHARDARASVDSCSNCHEQTFCSDCHAQTVPTRIELRNSERVDVDFIHRNDYLSRHAIEAHADPASCRRCHGTSYCESCHAAQNLTPTAANPRNPHPPGWSIPGAPNSHSRAARDDVASCASCHEDGPRSICIQCHKVGGTAGNPHPPGWRSRHPMSEVSRNSMCLYCHL